MHCIFHISEYVLAIAENFAHCAYISRKFAALVEADLGNKKARSFLWTFILLFLQIWKSGVDTAYHNYHIFGREKLCTTSGYL